MTRSNQLYTRNAILSIKLIHTSRQNNDIDLLTIRKGLLHLIMTEGIVYERPIAFSTVMWYWYQVG